MQKTLRATYIIIFLLVLYLPIAILVGNSLNLSVYGVKWEGFTIKWYQKALDNFALMEALKNSLILAFTSALCTSIIATISALSFYMYRYIGRKVIYFSIQVMIVLPDIIVGIGLLFLFTLLQIELGYFTLLIGHIALSLPFTVITVFAGFKGLDKNVIEVAKDLGATDYQIFLKIILPIILPNIMSAYLIAFTLSLDDVLVSYFVSGANYEILPLVIYSLARLGVKPEVNAVCTLMLLFSILLIGLSQALIRKKL